MDEFSHNFMERPPWSGQSVRPWARFLAWVFVFLALIAGVIGAVFITLEGGIPAAYLPVILLGLIGELYFVAVLFHVGTKGVAPSSWLPWK